MTVPPEADQVDHHIGTELVAILERHAADADHRVGVFAIHMEDRDRQALGQIGREAAGIGLAAGWW